MTGMMIGSFPFGWLSDKYGRKPTLMLTLFLLALGGSLPYPFPAPHSPQMYNQQPPLMQPHNPISPGYLPPHNNYETNSVTSSGYYSEHPSQLSPVPSQLSPPVHQYGTPGYRGDGLAFNRDNGYSRESLSPSSHSTYSDSSVHSAFVPTTPNTANMIKDDENIIHDILEWEKY